MTLEAIKYCRGHLELLDQRLLPLQSVHLEIPGPDEAYVAIKDMVVRGAPAIGVTAALAVAVDLWRRKTGSEFATAAEVVEYVRLKTSHLVESRPTAVNLADACSRLNFVAEAAAGSGATAASVIDAVVHFSEKYFRDDIEANKAMGRYGADAMLAACGVSAEGGLNVLTHCNTGALATAGWGTALGVIRTLAQDNKLAHVYPTETRPYNQGARLTAYELVHDGLPATLVCDSAACSLMGAGRVDGVVVGADRVAANGDTANKIGTHALAVLAKHYGVPFFIAAPTTTLDARCPSGSAIVIEERGAEEVTHWKGERVVAEGMQVWNPAFDVTPAQLITGIITEKGCVPKRPDGTFDIASFLKQHSAERPHDGQGVVGNGHVAAGCSLALSESRVRDYIVARPQLLEKVGPAGSGDSWSVREVGDGNINFVFIVEGPYGGLCLKQGLGFVRCVGETWPLTQDRIRIEAAAMQEAARHCPGHVPEIFLYDSQHAIIVMSYIAPPALILRRGLLAGHCYPSLAQHMADYLALTLVNTSLLKVKGVEFRRKAAELSNPDMCELTESVVFTEPYYNAPNNRWTAPQLDLDVQALWADVQAKKAATALKAKFCCRAEALLHGDLHLGSLMVTQQSTYVIDAEFAFYGPWAFDVAKFIFDLLLSWFALAGHEAGGPRQAQRQWLLQCMRDTWRLFCEKVLGMLSVCGEEGELFTQQLFGKEVPGGAEALQAAGQELLDELWLDVVSFGGAFIIRRIVGIAHVLEMDSIADAETRSLCERRALRCARDLLVNYAQYRSMDDVVAAAERFARE